MYSFIAMNRQRLADSYLRTTKLLRYHDIRFHSAEGSHFLLIDARSILEKRNNGRSVSIVDETNIWRALMANGIYIAPGHVFHTRRPGYFRLTFAQIWDKLENGINKLAALLSEKSNNKDRDIARSEFKFGALFVVAALRVCVFKYFFIVCFTVCISQNLLPEDAWLSSLHPFTPPGNTGLWRSAYNDDILADWFRVYCKSISSVRKWILVVIQKDADLTELSGLAIEETSLGSRFCKTKTRYTPPCRQIRVPL